MKSEKQTALVVEDHPTVLEALERNLGDRGYEVKTAFNARDAKKYSDERFDLVIIDGLNGECFDVYDMIDAQRKFIFTGNNYIIKQAKEKGIEVHCKSENLRDILK